MDFSFDKCRQIPPPLEPYGDISGLGVVLGFVLSAWLTIIILVAYYCFAFDPNPDPFRSVYKRNEPESYLHKPNPLDALMAKCTRRLRSQKSFRGSLVESAFHKCILSLADAQLVTGFSILISGYWALKHGQGLSAYHWKMLVFLAWFSSVTHLSALTFLRGYLALHPAGRLWRVSMMFSLLVLLFVGFIPTGHFEFLGDRLTYAQFVDLGQTLYPKDCDNFGESGQLYYNWSTQVYGKLPTLTPYDCNISGEPVYQLDRPFTDSNIDDLEYLWLEPLDDRYNSYYSQAEIAMLKESPAVCFFRGDMKTSSNAFVSMVSSLVLLVYGYLIRTAKLFEGPSRLISMRVQDGLDRAYEALMKVWERRLSRTKTRRAVILASIWLPFQSSIYCTLRVFIHLYTSMFAEVFSVVLSAAWGTSKMWGMKRLGNPEDNEWTFGQVIPLALLSGSVVPIFELLYKSLVSNFASKDLLTIQVAHPNQAYDPAYLSYQSEYLSTPTFTNNATTFVRSPEMSFSPAGRAPNDGYHPTNTSALDIGLLDINVNQRHPSTGGSTTTSCAEPQTNTDSVSREFNYLIDTETSQTPLANVLARLTLESSNAYSRAWTKSLVFILLGPVILAILQFFGFGGGGLVNYKPTNDLVAAAKTLGFLVCFVQEYLFLRMYIWRIQNSKVRKSTAAFTTMAIMAVSIIFIMFTSNGMTVYGMMIRNFTLGGMYGLQIIVAILGAAYDFRSLDKET